MGTSLSVQGYEGNARCMQGNITITQESKNATNKTETTCDSFEHCVVHSNVSYDADNKTLGGDDKKVAEFMKCLHS